MKPVLVLLTCFHLRVAFPVSGEMHWTRLVNKSTFIRNDPSRKGLVRIERTVTMGNLWLRYRQSVDPARSNKPVVLGYGDYYLSCGFPARSWNWNLEYFIDVFATAANGKLYCINRASLQEGTFVLETGERAVVDMVWPAPVLIQGLPRRVSKDSGATAGEGRAAKPGTRAPGYNVLPSSRLSLRFVKPSPTSQWFFLKISLEHTPRSSLTRIRLSGYPWVTTGPPERQRWIGTLARDMRLKRALQPIRPQVEWGVVFHNRKAQEYGGGLLVFLPEEISRARVAGDYGVSIELYPVDARQVLHIAVGYFWNEHYQEAIKKFRRRAHKVQALLRRVSWRARGQADLWEKLLKETHAIASNDLSPAWMARWRHAALNIQELLDSLAPGATTSSLVRSALERELAKRLDAARTLKKKLYVAALQQLLARSSRAKTPAPAAPTSPEDER